MKNFPVFLDVAGKVIVIFGAGPEAAAKLRLVRKTKAKIILVAKEQPDQAMQAAYPQWRQNWWPGDPLQYPFPRKTVFAYAATGDTALDGKIAHYARAQRILVCAADQPAVSDFITPAMIDRDPVVVAIGTEGNAPVLARQIKAQLESFLEPALGQIAILARSLRGWVAEHIIEGAMRRDFWQDFFAKARQADRLRRHQAFALARDLRQNAPYRKERQKKPAG